jgi:hypothetical protein
MPAASPLIHPYCKITRFLLILHLRGYAIIANKFIKTINQSFAADIFSVSVEQVSKTDPLIFTDSGHEKQTG